MKDNLIMLPPWAITAFKYEGLTEAAGKENNPIIAKFYSESLHPEVKDDVVPWCAAFVGACLAESGFKGTGTLWALDYAKWGDVCTSPCVGSIATKKRKGGGHVFFVVGFDDVNVWGLGGNQNDKVCVSKFKRNEVFSYSWPKDATDQGIRPDFTNKGFSSAGYGGRKET